MFRAQQNAFDEVVGKSFLGSKPVEIESAGTWETAGLGSELKVVADRFFFAVVVKATDENLTSENWEFIMVCCQCFLPTLPCQKLMTVRRMSATRWTPRTMGEFGNEGRRECRLAHNFMSWEMARELM